MSTTTYLGIDNGPSGTLGILREGEYAFFETPVVKVQDYTKAKKQVSRIDQDALRGILASYNTGLVKALIERPLKNPKLFNASWSAAICHEATLIALEEFGIGYEFCDSREWQKVLLPQGTKGSPALKAASADIGSRMYPLCAEKIRKHGDADGLLIATYLSRRAA